jgi:catechol 2,3-dioxygenase-like lactoylglutathione lyase family enzyme
VRRLDQNVRMPTLNLEHIACNVADPAAMAAWYVEHLGMRVARHPGGPSHIHFLAGAAGRAVIEIYCNAADPIPDYAAMNPLRSTSLSPPPTPMPRGRRSSPRARRSSTNVQCRMDRGC